MKRRYIAVERGVVRRLAAEYGVSVQSVRSALRYATWNQRAKQIRQSALHLGGVVMEVQPQDAARAAQIEAGHPGRRLTSELGALKRRLAEEAGVTRETVRLALKGKVRSRMAARLRERAVELGYGAAVEPYERIGGRRDRDER